MSPDVLRRSTPSAEGVDARGIEALLDALEAHPHIRPHGFVLLRHGAIIADGWWAPYSADRVQLLYSLSKSFTSTAAGFARAEGLLELDTPVIDYFPEYDTEITDPRTRRMTVRHIAAMASGHATETLDRALQAGLGDLVLGFLRTPLDAEPGTDFAYNQPCTYTLAAIVQRVTGQTLSDYLRPRLFEPLGIRDTWWEQAPPGREIGFSGLHAATDAAARLGQLYLQRGRWGDTQLLDASWVDEATRVQVATDGEGTIDWNLGYGLQFWQSQHGYRGDGAYGQFALVLPEHDAVLALTTESTATQDLLQAVWSLLIPAFDRATDAAADARVAERLANARLPIPAAGALPEHPEPWRDVAFAVPDAGAKHPTSSLREVRLRPAADSGKRWELVLVDAHGELVCPLGTDAWEVSTPGGIPLGVAGGWGPDGFVVELAFLETPHTLRISCAPGGHALTSWVTEPLGSHDIRSLRRLG
ncbi:MAG: serine hydrolase domain-containing protein [Protaetiibacter sp.]